MIHHDFKITTRPTSSLRNYSMPATIAAMRAAMRTAIGVRP